MESKDSLRGEGEATPASGRVGGGQPPAEAIVAPVAAVTTAVGSASQRHRDPYRIRGEALRRSLYFTLIAWIPGSFWAGATGGAPAIELGKYLGANDFVFALLGAVPLVSVLLQIPGSVAVEWIGARKRFFIWTVTPHRALFVLIGLLPWIMPVGVAWPAMVMVMIMLLSMSLSNFGGQAWTNWMADLVPPRIRGKYFARRVRLGIPVACLAGLGPAVLLDVCQDKWFIALLAPVTTWAKMPALIFLTSLIFMVAGLIGMLDILSFVKVDEPVMRRVPREALFRRLLTPLRDAQFMRFVLYWSAWNMAQGFSGWIWWVFLLDFFGTQKAAGVHAWWTNHMYVAATLLLGVCFQVGQFLGYPVWGRAVDRFGNKPVFFLSSTLNSVGWVWWIFLSPAVLPWLFLTQMISGFNYGGQDIASFNVMLQFNRNGGPAYQALGSVIFSVAGAVAAIVSGELAANWLRNFHWTFGQGTIYQHTFDRYAVLVAIGVAIKYAGDFLLLPLVQDVHAKGRRHALRYVLDNTYGSLNTMIFNPLKIGVGIAGRGLDGVRERVSDAAGEQIRRWWK